MEPNKQGVISSLAYLALLTMADGAATSLLGPLLSDGPSLQPGYWNLGAVAIMVSTGCELTGQIIVGVVADEKSRGFAMVLNTASIFLFTLMTALALAFHDGRPVVVSVLAPLAKLIGGGSHASAFLTYALLHEHTSGDSRVALLFSTGAVAALAQAASTALTSATLGLSIGLSFIFPIVCELLAFGVATFYSRSLVSDPSSEPLLPIAPVSLSGSSHDNPVYGAWVLSSAKELRILVVDGVLKDKNLALLALVIAVAGVSKATRPLFTTYIQRRYDFSPAEVSISSPNSEVKEALLKQYQSQALWLIRLLISTAIFLVITPLGVYFNSRWELTSPSRLALIFAKTSILLMGTGALMIGLALTRPVLIAALVVNTLGVAMDLSALAFIVGFVPEDFVGRYFQLIASIESLSALIGIAALYPVYQWGLDQDGYARGTVYYICATLYAITAVTIYQMKPAGCQKVTCVRCTRTRANAYVRVPGGEAR